jgi:phosphatidylglycerol:prolipoprotein diacylglycerol transferase
MLTYPEFDPVIFALGPLKIRWYGMMYVVGFIVGWWLAKRRAQQAHSAIKPQHVDDLVFYVMLGVILGGRLGYTLFYGWQDIAADPLYIFKIWEGGMSFHGGLIGVLIAMWLYGRKLGNTLWQMTDFVAPLVPIGLGMGRIGNFINGELWGKPTDVPWGVMYRGQVLHPNQLYEALLEGLLLFLILWFYSARPRPYRAVSGLFLLLYGIFRVFIEFFRVPDAHIGYLAGGWLTMGHVLSAPMIIAGAVLIVMAYRSDKKATA